MENSGPVESALDRAGRAIREADALLVTAGAGMGVDSGLPDFRGREGFWRAYPAVARRGLSFEQMANPEWFHRAPALAWAFYGHRLNLYRKTAPHAGFERLLEWSRRCRLGGFVFTSNVDGHFQKAGFPADGIVECHGSIHHFQCTRPCGGAIWDAGGQVVQVRDDPFEAVPPLPSCPNCGALARPNVLMFGDMGWIPDRTEAQETRLAAWLQRLRNGRGRLVILEFGAGTAVPTVRRFSESLAAAPGSMLIRVNPREPGTASGQIGLPLGAADAISRLARCV